MKVVSSWSGGKDSCFACYKAIQAGYEVSDLFTMMMNETKSNFHMIRSDILDAQADAIGIPLLKQKTTLETYERDFITVLHQFKAKGAEALVTGDIYEVAGHEEGWLNRVCKEVGLDPIKPLWMGDTKKIYLDYLKSGFEATVVRTKLDLLGMNWLGRQLDDQFLTDIVKLGNVDPCGEGGEYHTLVTDGPFFKNSIVILESEKQNLNGYGYLDIKRFEVKEKRR